LTISTKYKYNIPFFVLCFNSETYKINFDHTEMLLGAVSSWWSFISYSK